MRTPPKPVMLSEAKHLSSAAAQERFRDFGRQAAAFARNDNRAERTPNHRVAAHQVPHGHAEPRQTGGAP